MSDLLSIGAAGVAAYQRALTTVSNNISNVGTEGYVRQETTITETTPRQQGRIYVGTGSAVSGIKRAYDQFLEQNLRNTTSEMNAQGPLVDYANRVVDIMASDTVGLPGALDEFFSAARLLSADPASTILRSQFLTKSDGIAARFRELSSQMSTVDNETREAINSRLADVNTLASQLGAVNKQLARKALVDRQPPDLLDQRDLLLTKLSALVKINVTTATNGSVKVNLGNIPNTGTLVEFDKAVPLVARFSESDLSKVAIIADPYSPSPTEVVGIGGGELGGLMTFREQVLQPSMTALDSLATTVVKEINAVHGNGIDANGEIGGNLFRIDQVTITDPVSGKVAEIDRAAAGMRVSITDPYKVAAGALFRVIESETNLSGVDATLSYQPSWARTVKPLSAYLSNNDSPAAGKVPPKSQLLGQIPVGAANWSLFLDNASGDQQVQVFTRDGRQLAGSELSQAQQELLMTSENGFNAGTSYSKDYLNKTGVEAYKQTSLFYGQIAKPGQHYNLGTQFTTTNSPLPTTVLTRVTTGRPIPSGIESIAANHLKINGKVLPGLTPKAPAITIQASDLALWLNTATAGMQPPVTVSASNQVVLNLTNDDAASGVTINGIKLTGLDSSNDGSLTELRDRINDEFRTYAHAELDDETNPTQLILTNAEGYEGRDLNVNGQSFKGTLDLKSDGDISIGYAEDGERGDINLLGRPSGSYYTEIRSTEPYQASIAGSPIPSGVELIPNGALTLNGKSLPGLDLDRTLEARDYVSWLNAAGAMGVPPVHASASNVVTIPASQLSKQAIADRGATTSLSLTLNGVSITKADSSDFTSIDDIAAAINSAQTGSLSIDLSKLKSGDSVVINGTRFSYDGDPQQLFDDILDAQQGAADLDHAQSYLSANADQIVLVGLGNGDVIASAQADDNALGLLTVPREGLQLDQPLTLNNVVIGTEFTSAKQMIDAINASSAGVTATASFDQDGNLSSDIVLSGALASDITNDPTGSALGSSVSGAVVSNPYVIDAAQFDPDQRLMLNGVAVFPPEFPPASVDGYTKEELVDAINAKSVGTNVFAKIDGSGNIELQTDMPGGMAIGSDLSASALQFTAAVGAYIDVNGNLLLSNDNGGDIRIGTETGTRNVLGIGNGRYKGSLSLGSDAAIRVGFGDTGTAAQMSNIGFRSGLYLDGAATEDLLVFVTGEGGGTLSASYDASMADPATLNAKRIDQLRTESYDVKFTSDQHYQIVWTNPANGRVTVLAERDYDPAAGIHYQGVTLALNGPPKAGDKYTIDGNQDGTGNNQNINDLLALEKRGIVGGGAGMTIAQAYEQQVGNVGNIASQASIAKDALTVVNDQAVEARDKVSGVSLDSEAADLIRFQQAYQAAAKTIQVASDLFDAILSAAR